MAKKEVFDSLVQQIPSLGEILTMKKPGGLAKANVLMDTDGRLSIWVNAHVDNQATGWYLSGETHRGLRCYLDDRSKDVLIRKCGGRLDDIKVDKITVIDVVDRGSTKYLVCEIDG